MAQLGNLASRLLVAVVAVPVLLLAIYQDSPVFTWGLIWAASLIAMHELFAMTLDDATDRTASLAIGAASTAAMYWFPEWVMSTRGAPAQLFAVGPLLAVGIAIVPIGLYYLFRFGDMSSVADRFARSITGVVYGGLSITFLALIKRDFGDQGADLVVFVLLCTWGADTGAYFAGRFLGKHKLYPEVSPKKTWEGALGGIAMTAVAATALKLTRLEWLTWVDVGLLALPGGALGQMGDLVESLIKRSRGVKDSGSLLPGHGGILDRIDAVLFFAPYVYLYLMIKVLVVR